jgi:hypothetical protein
VFAAMLLLIVTVFALVARAIAKTPATTVRLGNNSTAFVDNSVRWRIQPAAADELFLDYRQFENVRDNLVTRPGPTRSLRHRCRTIRTCW